MNAHAHATLEHVVVVQVSGELSNRGQTMRPFVQTFILVPLSPKNYYVQKDMFHYQDGVFNNKEEDDVKMADTSIDNGGTTTTSANGGVMIEEDRVEEPMMKPAPVVIQEFHKVCNVCYYK